MDTGDEEPSRADVATIRQLYGDIEQPVSAVLAAAGISQRTLYRLAKREGWPLRSHMARAAGRPGARAAAPAPVGVRAARGCPVPVAASHEGSDTPVDRRAMANRLERFIASRIVAIESEPARGEAGGERQARTLNQLTRTAAAIRTYLETLTEDNARDDVGSPPPRSLAELRDELRRHLERIRDEERDRDVPGEPDPG